MNLVLAITGPAGSGKSTVAKIIANDINLCVNIDADYVKHFIVNGFIYDNSEKGVKQWELLGKNIGQLAEKYDVVLDFHNTYCPNNDCGFVGENNGST